jgi:hypothetical protein
MIAPVTPDAERVGAFKSLIRSKYLKQGSPNCFIATPEGRERLKEPEIPEISATPEADELTEKPLQKQVKEGREAYIAGAAVPADLERRLTVPELKYVIRETKERLQLAKYAVKTETATLKTQMKELAQVQKARTKKPKKKTAKRK